MIRAIARHKIIAQLEGTPIEETPEITFGRRGADAAATPPGPPPAAPRGGSRLTASVAWLAAILAVGAAGYALTLSPGEVGGAAALRLETSLAALERQLANVARPEPPRPDPRIDEMLKRIDALDAEMRKRIEGLEARPLPEPAAPATAAVAPAVDEALAARLAALEEQLAAREQRASIGPDPGQVAAAMAENRRLSNEVARLQEQVGALSPTQPRGPREGLLVAIGQLREAARRGAPFAAELRIVQALASDEADLAAPLAGLMPHAERPVPTREALVARFPALAAAASRAAQVAMLSADRAPADTVRNWWNGVVDRVSGLVSVRRVGDVPGDGEAARLARGDRAIAAGDLAGALAALDGLAGPAGGTLAPWLAEARARLAVDRQVDLLLGAALAAVAAAPR